MSEIDKVVAEVLAGNDRFQMSDDPVWACAHAVAEAVIKALGEDTAAMDWLEGRDVRFPVERFHGFTVLDDAGFPVTGSTLREAVRAARDFRDIAKG